MPIDVNPYLEAIAQDIRDAIVRQGLETTGHARNSVMVRNNRNVIAAGYVSTLFQGIGRRPGRNPPVRNIEQWVVAKGLQFVRNGRPMTSTQMAFAIANKIGRSGTRIFRGRRRGIQVRRIIEKNNAIYMPRIARELKNTYVKEFNLAIVT